MVFSIAIVRRDDNRSLDQLGRHFKRGKCAIHFKANHKECKAKMAPKQVYATNEYHIWLNIQIQIYLMNYTVDVYNIIRQGIYEYIFIW